jgi:SnoaL-like domain
MTATWQELADRLDITDTVTRYSYGIDQRIWSEWDQAFTSDAVIDFSFWGIEACRPAQLRERFSSGDAARISGQHLLSNQLIWIDGDTARSHVEFTMTTLARSDDPAQAIRNSGGGWYEDELVRTSAGWRIRRRRGLGKWHVQDTIAWNAAQTAVTPVVPG